MKLIETKIKIFILTIGLLIASTFYRTNEVCCMFASMRQFGFPGQILILGKETDSHDEAFKVKSYPTFYLLQHGWRPVFAAGMSSPISQSALLNLLANTGLCYIISKVVINIWESQKNEK